MEQVILRLGEKSNFNTVPDNKAFTYSLKKEHFIGRVPTGTHVDKQFGEIVLKETTLKCEQSDNCVKVCGKMAKIVNIITVKGKIYVVIQYYRSQAPHFLHPLNSEELDIHRVSILSDELCIKSITELTAKYCLLPCYNDDCIVTIPIHHTYDFMANFEP